MNSLSYEEKKQQLIKDFKKCIEDHRYKVSLYKKSSNLFRARFREKNERRIDVRSFNRVLSVDKEKLVAEVEGMTQYEDLVNETLKYSCLPTVVPELKSITIGGALAGCGIESSSFRYGLVHETIQESEILLGDGRIVTCNPSENQDLFYGFPNTFGTLGYALKVKVQLIAAKKYVKLTHRRFNEPQAFFDQLESLCKAHRDGDVSFIDGVIFAPDELYVTCGEFVEEAPWLSDYRYRNIYYQSIRHRSIDYLTTLDYIWRWDPDWFWCSKVFYLQNPMLRLLFGKLMLNSKTYNKIMHFFGRHPRLSAIYYGLRGRRESIIQDTLIPVENALDFFRFFDGEIGIRPIWICPMQSFSDKAHYDFCPIDPKKLYLDFGFWDSVPTEHEEGYFNKKIEAKVRELKGFKSLYSSSYYAEKEFWELFDHSKYVDLKQKYDPSSHFKDLFHKCTKADH